MTLEGENRKGTYRSMTPAEIGLTIRQLYKHTDWSRQMLAEHAGLHEYTIERVESEAKVDEQSLRKIAQALGLPEDTFVKETIYLATAEEQYEEFTKAWKETVQREPRRLASLEDCDAVLTVRAYAIDPQNIPDEVTAYAQAVIDTITERTREYLFRTKGERRADCRALLAAVRRFEAKGYRTEFAVTLTEDQISLATMRFRPGAKGNSKKVETIAVPRKVQALLDAVRKRE